MIYKNLNFYEFRDAFISHDRKDQFSHEGLEALFNYYDSFEEPVECDVIAICVEWTEVNEKPSDDYSYLETSIGTFLVQE